MSFKQTFVNPYDPNGADQQPETPPLDQIITQAIQNAMRALRVWLPGEVTQVLGNQKVHVQPLLKSRYTNGDVVPLPVIQNVMVSMPMGQTWSIKCPVEVGDTGYLLFCDRSLDAWSASDGGIVDPEDSRAHDLADPIFIPGLVPFANQTTDATPDLVLTRDTAQIRLIKGGKFKIENGSQELLANLANLVNLLSTASTVAGGPFIPSVVTQLQQIAQNIESLQG